MMDAISSASAVVGLVFSFAAAIKACNDIRSRYKEAGRTVGSIQLELETLRAALQELGNTMMHDASSFTSQWNASKTLSVISKSKMLSRRLVGKPFQPLQRQACLFKHC